MAPGAVSVVIATRNRAACLERCLTPLLGSPPSEVGEIVIVDDASSDETRVVVAAAGRDPRVVARNAAGQGAAAARNVGLRAATGAIVAVTDDDCITPPGWAASLAARLHETQAAAAGGRVVAAESVSLPARMSQAITNGFVRALNRDARNAVFLTSNNVAYRAAALRAAGLFDESFPGAGGEERELHARLRARGERLVYAPDVVVTHCAALDWVGFWRQQLGYGRGARLYYRLARNHGSGAPRHFSPGTYAAALRAAWSEVAPRERPALLAAVALSQTAVAVGSLSPRPASLPVGGRDATVPPRQ